MKIKVIKSTDGRFCGQILEGETIDKAIMPLFKRLGGLNNTKIINDIITFYNSNYLLVIKIIEK